MTTSVQSEGHGTHARASAPKKYITNLSKRSLRNHMNLTTGSLFAKLSNY